MHRAARGEGSSARWNGESVRGVYVLDASGSFFFPFSESPLLDSSLLLGGDCTSLINGETGSVRWILEICTVLDVLGGSRHALGFMLDRGLHSFRAIPLGRAFTAYGSFSALRPRFMTAYGSLLIPEEPQGLAAYGYYSHLGLRQILVAVTGID